MDLFYIFKFNTSELELNNYNINLSISEARIKGNLISIGYNQLLHQIFKFKNINLDNNYIKNLYNARDDIKLKPDSIENRNQIQEIQNNIDKLLFIPEIINITSNNKKIYKYACKNGVEINGTRYKRFICGSGAARRNTATFIDEKIFLPIYNILMNGLSIKEINLSKFNAYFGLYSSAITKVTTPRICLISDSEAIIKNKKVDYIVDKIAIDKDDKSYEYRDVEERIIDFKSNEFDGAGLISPQMAEIWSRDLNLKYIPSQFIIRSSFIKGMVSVFDFHKFSEVIAEKDKIIDVYGKEWDIDKIDMILSVSQFKMWRFYQSWDEYVENCKKYEHIFGVSRYTPKIDNEYSLLNYQYIQVLDLDTEKINKLIQPTVDWIKKICSGDKLYTLLFLLGSCDVDDNVENILDRVGNDYVKALIYNDELYNDPYIRKKIYNSIERRIKDAKLGRLWVEGNYQIMVPDPFKQCEFAFGMDAKGLLKEGEYYSKFWIDRNKDKVCACRSPLTDPSEINILKVVSREELEDWYRYQSTGIIYNTYGLDTVIHADSDWDGDIIFTTCNEVFINSVYKDLNPVTYDKVSTEIQKLTFNNIIKADLQSFDCKVGQVTNKSTTFIAMRDGWRVESKEYEELTRRIKICRRYQGDAIDATKGIITKSFPKEWTKVKKGEEGDSEEVKKEKKFLRRVSCQKQPYFMIYLYNDLMKKFRIYRKKKENESKRQFKKKLDGILRIKNSKLIQEEIYFKMGYSLFSPILSNNSIMNIICRIIEKIDFDCKYKNEVKFNYSILINKNIKINKKKLNKIDDLFKEFNRGKNKIKNDRTLSEDEYNLKFDELILKIKEKSYLITSNISELANLCVIINYEKYKNSNKLFTWSIEKEGIISNIIINQQLVKYMPIIIKNKNEIENIRMGYCEFKTIGGFKNQKIINFEELEYYGGEYLGNHYKLRRINNGKTN